MPINIVNQSPAEALDRFLDKGIFLPESSEICCPTCGPYVLASVETFLKFAEAEDCTSGQGICNCCARVYASVETYLKYAEAVGNDGIADCQNNETFIDCLEEIQSTYTEEEIDRLLDKGLVEYGSLGTPASTQLCLLNTFVLSSFNLQTVNPSSRPEILDRILDKGIVIDCNDGETVIAGIETYLKYKEAVGSAPP